MQEIDKRRLLGSAAKTKVKINTDTTTYLEKVNDGLVRLDLSYNEISSRGVLVIAQALEDNDRLEVLRLDGNRYV